jgi:signal transduction histidine kinase
MELEKEKTLYQDLYMEIHNLSSDLMNVTSLFRHDLLNDLSVIQSSLNVYEDTNEKRFLDKIYDRINIALQRVNSLGSTSGILNSLRTQPLSVNSISDVIDIFDNVEFKPSSEETYIEFSNLLYPIMINLIQNAFQHGGKNTRVRVEISQQDKEVTIKVKDDGIGVSNEDKKNIFKKDFRKSDKGVSGMGLFLIKNIVQRYEGAIKVEDNEPKGTVFTLTFPRYEENN